MKKVNAVELTEEQQKRLKGNMKILKVIGIVFGLFILLIISLPSNDKPTTNVNTSVVETPRVETKQEKIESQFSLWDGSHKQLERVIKMSLKDPDSYEHISSNYWDMNNGTIVVVLKYRARNSFGGMVVNWVKARADIESGDMTEIIEQG